MYVVRYVEEIYDLPGYSGTAEEEIRCSVIISNNAIATEAGACVEHPASSLVEALGFFFRGAVLVEHRETCWTPSLELQALDGELVASGARTSSAWPWQAWAK